MALFAKQDEAKIEAEIERRVRVALAAAGGDRLGLPEASRILGCSVRTARREIDTGAAPAGRLTGRRLTFALAEVEEWRARREDAQAKHRRALSARARAALELGRAKLEDPEARRLAREKAAATRARNRSVAAPERRPVDASTRDQWCDPCHATAEVSRGRGR